MANLSELLNKAVVWCPVHKRLFSLNETLAYCKTVETHEKLLSVDSALITLLNTDISTDLRNAVQIVLQEVQKMYQAQSIDKDFALEVCD